MSEILVKIFGTRISFYAIVGLLAAVLITYGVFSYRLALTKGDLATATAQVTQLQGVNQQNAITMQQLQEQHGRDLQALTAAKAADLARATETATFHGRINNAKPSDDGPVAPVLRDLLNSLRGKGPQPDPVSVR